LTDAAFRAGIVLASAILWTIAVAAGMAFLGVATHLWILSVLTVAAALNARLVHDPRAMK
jgi:hypothetical protein